MEKRTGWSERAEAPRRAAAASHARGAGGGPLFRAAYFASKKWSPQG
mgnify:CR=1 FL=1